MTITLIVFTSVHILFYIPSCACGFVFPISPAFSAFSPVSSSYSDNCNVSTNDPCNSSLFRFSCDLTVCAALRSLNGEKRSVCSCLNYKRRSHIRFQYRLLHLNTCKPYHESRIHDYTTCMHKCEELHQHQSLAIKISSHSYKRTFGCVIHNKRPSHSLNCPISEDGTLQHRILCFCYTYAWFGNFGFERFMRLN